MVVLLLLAPPLSVCLAAGAAFGLGRFAMAVARYFDGDGNRWAALIHARAVLVRSSSAVIATVGAIVLAVAA